MDEKIFTGFVILLDKKVEAVAKSAYTKISGKFETFYNLSKFYPHITLYQAKFKPDKIEILKEEFKKLLKGISNFKISMNGLEFFQNYIFWNCAINENLKNLHEKVLRSMSKYHIKSEPNVNLDEKMKENFLKYGYPLAIKLYKPHITITAIKSKIDASKAMQTALPLLNVAEFMADKFAVCLLSHAGEAIEILETVEI